MSKQWTLTPDSIWVPDYQCPWLYHSSNFTVSRPFWKLVSCISSSKQLLRNSGRALRSVTERIMAK